MFFLDFSKNSEVYKKVFFFKLEWVERKLGSWKFYEKEFEKVWFIWCGFGWDIVIFYCCYGDNCLLEGSRNVGKFFMICFFFGVICGIGK